MQAFRRFLFHGHAKRVAFDVMSAQRAEKNDRSGCDSEDDKNRNRSSADQCFPSQGGKMGREKLGLQSYIGGLVCKLCNPFNFLTNHFVSPSYAK